MCGPDGHGHASELRTGVVREVRPAQGETGRGAALWPLAEAVGPTGHITGIDLADQMIAATRRDAAARGLSNVELVRSYVFCGRVYLI